MKIADSLRRGLIAEGYAVDVAHDGPDAVALRGKIERGAARLDLSDSPGPVAIAAFVRKVKPMRFVTTYTRIGIVFTPMLRKAGW